VAYCLWAKLSSLLLFPEAEVTRDDLRRQVYEAMAEDKKPEGSDSTAVAAEGESGKDVAEQPLEPCGNGLEKGPGSPTSVLPPVVSEMKGNGVKQSLVTPESGAGDCPHDSPSKESTNADKKVATEEAGNDKAEHEQEAESGEGNISFHAEHWWSFM